MKITACIVTYNNEDTIEKCVESILNNTKELDFTLYVSDNCSTDRTTAIIREKFPKVVVLDNEKNGGFGYGHNIALKKVKSDIHFVVNPDIYMDTDVFGPLATYLMENENTYLVTPKVLNNDGTEQFLPKNAPTFRYVIVSKFPGFRKYRKEYTRENDVFTEPTRVGFCTGCFFAVRTRDLKKLGGFNKRFYMYFEDADLSKRVINMGKDIVFYPNVYIYHDWHRDNTKSITGAYRFLSSMMKYFLRWGFKF